MDQADRKELSHRCFGQLCLECGQMEEVCIWASRPRNENSIYLLQRNAKLLETVSQSTENTEFLEANLTILILLVLKP